ncbi:ROK family protein [Meridianimarinicoccus aquatilis]|uniref:ROK family protein n=1 Tax=Meridianimarinicoccus aquatilis TaxID=2552766 RepID=A0A4R6API6_9RHOB|nr:ROK family protein [Fluviibacterium aquatile]TDL85435.1 ROK family protein [Fluviibacterium aquatile]
MSRAAETNGSVRGTKGRPRNSDGAAPSLTKILNLVRTGQATTRQEIERTSELGRAIVTDRLTTLTALDLVDESELGVATGGRAPRLVRFNANAGLVLVATLDQTALGVALSDLSGKLLTEHHEALDLNAPAEDTMSRLESLFEWILEKSARTQKVWGIGISVPAPVQTPSGGLLSTSPPILPAWDGTAYVERLIQTFKAPVWLRSSVGTMAMGELHDGEVPPDSTMLFVKIGKRIGAGLVVDGKLYRGAQGAAGLIGQLPVASDGLTGPLELLAGSDTIAQAGRSAAKEGESPYLAEILARGGEITSIDVGQAAQAGDVTAMEVMSRSGRLIGHVVAALANMLNPSHIVLSGSVAQTNDILLAAVREVVYGESHPLVTRDLRITASRLGSSAGLIGGAAVVVDALFATEFLRSWITKGSPLGAPKFEKVIEVTRAALAHPEADTPDIPSPPRKTDLRSKGNDA